LDSDLNADNVRLGSDVVLHVHHFLCDGIVVAVIAVKIGIIYRVEIYKKAGCVSRVRGKFFCLISVNIEKGKP
jgi:hypothetical protein